MPKKTRLDESAEIYQPRSEKTEREKLKDMSIKGKLSYLWEYYKIHAFITVAAVALLIYVIHEIITPDVKPQFNAAIINGSVYTTSLEQYADAFAQRLQLDPMRESVVLNNNFFTDYGGLANSSAETLVAYIAGGEIDVIIAPETNFKQYAYYGYFKKLSEALPTDIYSSLTDYFFISDQEEDPEKSPYGIYLDNTDLFKDAKYKNDSYVLGIMANGPHADNTVEFIKYLFEKK
jgi:hypothetical protein